MGVDVLWMGERLLTQVGCLGRCLDVLCSWLSTGALAGIEGGYVQVPRVFLCFDYLSAMYPCSAYVIVPFLKLTPCLP